MDFYHAIYGENQVFKIKYMSTFEIIKALGTQNKRKFNDVFLVKLFDSGDLAVLKVLKKMSI